MAKEPRVVFGRAYGAFFVSTGQNDLHQHVAFQIVLSAEDDITVVDENNDSFTGRFILIKPLTLSKFRCDGPVTHLFLSPIMGLTLDLINLVGDANIHILTSTQELPFNPESSPDEILDVLDNSGQKSIERLDSRLLAVLEDLDQNLDNPSILKAAKRCGLSRSRVRTIARQQLGIPLSTWITWRKLVAANKALSAGADLQEAALEGHFADHAHFSRTMKKMFGVTPTEALRIYT